MESESAGLDDIFAYSNHSLPEGQLENSNIILDGELDWPSPSNEPDLPQMEEHVTVKQEGEEVREGTEDTTAIAEADDSVQNNREIRYKSPPDPSINEYAFPALSQTSRGIFGYNQYITSAEDSRFASSAPYSEPDTDSSPVLFAAGIESMHNVSKIGPAPTDRTNLDYYQFPFQRTSMRPTPAVRTRAATMSSTRDLSPSNNAGLDDLAYPNPLPTLQSLRYKYSNSGPSNSIAIPEEIPNIEELMDPLSNGVDIDTLFSSAEEASSYHSQEFSLPRDPTLPTTIEQKKAIVKALCNAINSVEHAEDNPGMIKPFAEQKYSEKRVELACWNLLEACMARHISGPLLAVYDIKCKHSSEIPTFAERIGRIFTCLITQKTICKHLLDPFYLYSFVDDPIGAHKRVIANKTLNKRKGEVMNAGKQVLGHARGNSTASSGTPGAIELGDPFGSISPFSTPRRGRVGTNIIEAGSGLSPAVTPDSVNRRGLASMILNSPEMSSPGSERHAISGLQRDMISGTSSFNATPNLRHINRSLHSSPIMGNAQGPGHGLPGLPRSHSVQGTPQTLQELDPTQRSNLILQYQSAYLAGIDPSLRQHALRRMTAPTSHPRPNMQPVPAPVTPAKKRKTSTSSNTPGSRRKRRSSDSDDSEYLPSPAKKTQR